MTDRWAAQLKSFTKGHQICLAHLLRNSMFLQESEKHPFAAQFRQFMIDIFEIRKVLIKQNKPFAEQDKDAKELEKRLNDLLLITVDKDKYPNTLTFQASMMKHRNHIMPCLYNLDIPQIGRAHV